MLIPNKNYYELFPDQAPPTAVKSVGYVTCFSKLAQKIGLTKTLTKVFGKSMSEKILSIAAYMMANGNVMMHYQDWSSRQDNEKIAQLTSQNISDIFATIDEENRIDFFTEWTKLHRPRGYVAYDVTSISSYSEEISLVEWGYNRDNDSLAQINLGMFYSEESMSPLFYKVYPGSVTDKSYFETVMAYLQHFGLEKVRLVMDQGLLSKSNLNLVNELNYKALSLLSKNLKLYKDTLDKIVVNTFSSREYLPKLSMYSRSYNADFSGVPVVIHFYYSAEKALIDEQSLYADIQRHQERLDLMSKQNKIKPSLKKYFKVEQEGDAQINYELDYDEIDKHKDRLGYFALISTDEDLSSEEALTLYREKDIIEKNFDQLKNGMDFKRMRTHQTGTAEGKTFIAFVALIVRNLMMEKVKNNENTEKYTLNEIIKHLENIDVLSTEDTKQLITLTKKQKQILEAFDLNIEY